MSHRLTGGHEKVHLRRTRRLSRSASLAQDTCSVSQSVAGVRYMPMITDKAVHEKQTGETGRKAARREGERTPAQDDTKV